MAGAKNIILIIAVILVICLIVYIIYHKSTEKFSGAFDPITRASISGIGPQTVTADRCDNCM
jgi:ABC-type cobalt transport system substrate-binding protein